MSEKERESCKTSEPNGPGLAPLSPHPPPLPLPAPLVMVTVVGTNHCPYHLCKWALATPSRCVDSCLQSDGARASGLLIGALAIRSNALFTFVLSPFFPRPGPRRFAPPRTGWTTSRSSGSGPRVYYFDLCLVVAGFGGDHFYLGANARALLRARKREVLYLLTPYSWAEILIFLLNRPYFSMKMDSSWCWSYCHAQRVMSLRW